MGLFGKKRTRPEGPLGADIGFCAVIVAPDGAVYVNQQHHHQVEPEVVAGTVALCWGLDAYHVTLRDRGRTQADHILDLLTRDRKAEDLNARVNPGGLIPNNPPHVVHPPGPSATASVRATATGGAIAIWRELDNFDAGALLRGFAGVWLVAAGHGVGGLVWHALRALPEDPMRDPRTMEEALEQPLRLFEAGARAQAATAASAAACNDVPTAAPPIREVAVEPAPEADAAPDPEPVVASEEDSPSTRLQRAMTAISDLLDAGAITTADAAHMRDRAMERFERSVTGRPDPP